MNSSKLGVDLVSYSDSDTDSDQDTNELEGSCVASSIDPSARPIRRDILHQNAKKNASPFDSPDEESGVLPCKKRRLDSDSDTSFGYEAREDAVACKLTQANNEPSTKIVEEDSSLCPTGTLSLPSAILDMFKQEGQDESAAAASEDHQGRVRSFAHVRGNWATHVFIPFESTPHISACIANFLNILQKHFRDHQFHAVPDIHLSLSRTVPVQHHWIEPLTNALRSKFKNRKGFTVCFRDIAFYTNDDCTRSFVGLDVISGYDQVYSLVQDVDECFSMYRLQQYYENPSFHVSLCWCLGDILKAVTTTDKRVLQDKWEKLLQEHHTSMKKRDIEIEITEVRCRTGNKMYSFPFTI